MLHLGQNRTRNRSNVLKKVKVDGKWKLCPAIVEPGGNLKDRVQVSGRAEVHNEGVYYIEWREDGQRIRQSVPNRHHVLERARLKALELDARTAGIHVDGKPAPPNPSTTAIIGRSSSDLPSMEINQISKAAGVIFRGFESYLQEII